MSLGLSPRQRVIKLFKANKELTEFDHFAQWIPAYKAEIKPIENPKYAAATFQSTANLSISQIIINTTHDDKKIQRALDHEMTHFDQQASLVKKGFIFTDFSVKSQIGYEVLSEAHAYSNEDEFDLKRDKNAFYSQDHYQQLREENILAFFAKSNQETLDIYIDQAISNAKNHNPDNEDMPLSLAASTLHVGKETFLEESDIQRLLRIENLGDITNKLIENSPLKEEFQARITKLER